MERDLRQLPRERVLIAPSILAADFSRLGAEIARVEAAGAELLHLDIMDGHLVPNLSFGPPVVSAIRPQSQLLFDTHLMLTHPLRYAEAFARAGADHLTFHLESEDDPETVIAEIRRLKLTVGISLRPGTPVERLLPYLEQIDLVLIMTVEPGFGGQRFLPETVAKIDWLHRRRTERRLRLRLEVDGGITAETAPVAVAAGADVLVAGSSIFRNPAGVEAALTALRG